MKEKPKTVKDRKELPPKDGGGTRKTQIRFKTLCDIRRFLARTLNDLDADKIIDVKARTLGYLCSVMRDVIRDSDLETRILKLEQEAAKNDNNA
ncbi:MAG: hypothetical protein Q8K00_08340 [Syntrophales bacterium]|nr:hypothetical protein [Syntrophales bacterium]